MKLILDFDDVLFNNTGQFKPRIFSCLERAGVPRAVAESYYQEVKTKGFSLVDFITTLFERFSISAPSVETAYQEIMSECPNFVNKKLLKIALTVGEENCFIVSGGDEKFQRDKITMSGIQSFFNEIFIVPDSKKDVIAGICEKNISQDVFFVEDKPKFLEDLPLEKYKNLKTILYDSNGLEKVRQAIAESM